MYICISQEKIQNIKKNLVTKIIMCDLERGHNGAIGLTSDCKTRDNQFADQTRQCCEDLHRSLSICSRALATIPAVGDGVSPPPLSRLSTRIIVYAPPLSNAV